MTSATQPVNLPADPREALDQAFAGTPVGGAGSDAAAEYRVHLPIFEGPLDLLLHLIRREQIDIYDIPIARICQSYLTYLNTAADPDMGNAGEFMVMASTLLFLKSAMLMPREEQAETEDPRMPLVQQLLEYERFQKAAKKLDALPWVSRELFLRPPTAAADLMPKEQLLDAPIEAVDAYQLLLALKAATTRTTQKAIRIEVDPVSIREKVVQMGELLETTDRLDLRALVPANPRKHDIIVAFFAMLELARMKFIEIFQHENFGPIYIRAVRPFRELNVGMLEQF